MRKWIKPTLNPADIRFWIVVFLLVRLFGITNPPLEIAHSWRMVTTNMYARNFLEVDNSILYTRVDMAGELTGITAKEFPLFNYLIYLVSLVFGWQHWYGRLINLIISSIGSYFFYLTVKRFFREKHAFASTIVLMGSIWFAYSRKIMPDTFSMSLVMAGLYYGLRYLYQGGKFNLFLYLILGSAGVLSKIPSVYVFCLFLFPFLDRDLSILRKIWILSASVLLLGLNTLWYFYWVPSIIKTYGFVHYPERAFIEGAQQIFDDPSGLFYRFYWSALMSYVSFGVFVGGILFAFIRKKWNLLLIFLLLLLTFFIFILKAGSSFTWHNYYIIPFVPAMAFVSGFLLSEIKWKWAFGLLLVVLAVEGIANQQHEFFVPPGERYKLDLEAIADSVSTRSDLIAVSGGHNPQQLYFAHRKGWALNDDEMDTGEKINNFRDLGARYLFVNKLSLIREFDQYPVVYENDHYRIYALH